ncbi:hypothetical protein OPQ81_011369 [Rhizoctonia solani]|nr:hypothetical protein OPQ81_011369 [Rhizoctonia solani]
MGARYLVSPSIRKAPSAYAIALGLPLRMLIPPTRFSKSVACTWRYHGQVGTFFSFSLVLGFTFWANCRLRIQMTRQSPLLGTGIYPQRVLFARIVIIPPSFSINRL